MDRDFRASLLAEEALDDMPLAAVILELDGEIIFLNGGARRLLGERRGENILENEGWGWLPGDGSWRALWGRLTGSANWSPFSLTEAETGKRVTYRGRRRPNGHVIITEDHNQHHRFAEHAEQLRELNHQLSHQQAIEKRLRSSLELTTELRRELAHRVKNNLAIVTALLRAKARSSDQAETAEALKEAATRIGSIAVVHGMLDIEASQERTNARALFDGLLTHLRESICPPNVELVGLFDEVVLGTDAALQLGLLINELVTNAIKHAFSGRATGQIKVSFERTGDDYLLTVSDDGTGIVADASKGSGSRIIDALAGQLGSVPKLHSGTGTSWTLYVPSNVIEASSKVSIR